MTQAVRSGYTHGIIEFLNLGTDLDQLDRDCFQMLWDDVADQDIALGGSSGYHESTCLDLIRNDRILTGVKTLNAVNTDLVSTGTLDVGTHAV